MQQRTLVISQAQMLALHTTPVEVIPAPGPHLLLVPSAITFYIPQSATPYAGGGDIYLSVGDPALLEWVKVAAAWMIVGAATKWRNTGIAGFGFPGGGSASVENKSAVLKNNGAAYTGTGPPIYVTIFYGTAKNFLS